MHSQQRKCTHNRENANTTEKVHSPQRKCTHNREGALVTEKTVLTTEKVHSQLRKCTRNRKCTHNRKCTRSENKLRYHEVNYTHIGIVWLDYIKASNCDLPLWADKIWALMRFFVMSLCPQGGIRCNDDWWTGTDNILLKLHPEIPLVCPTFIA